MHLSWLLTATLLGAASAYVQPDWEAAFAQFSPDIISRDVCVVGGGSSGTHAAIRLQQQGKSVIVVEKEDHLGGHTNTYIDPLTGTPWDYGVQIFVNTSVVKDYFEYLNVGFTNYNIVAVTESITTQNIDFHTGNNVTVQQGDPTTALQTYAAQLIKYAQYISVGFNLPEPVPEDLVLPFGQFVNKYNLSAAVSTIALIVQGVGDLMTLPTLYVMKYFSLNVLVSMQSGFLATASHDNSLIYQSAHQKLGSDNVLLSSSILGAQRDTNNSGVFLLANTPEGKKIIHAKKLLITIPPKKANLEPFDLDDTEKEVFTHFHNAYYYTALLNNTDLPQGVQYRGAAQTTSFNLPVLPGPYVLQPTSIQGVWGIFYGSSKKLSEEQVKLAMVEAIHATQKAAHVCTSSSPEFVAFSNHSPFELTVSGQEITKGFYGKLNQLQGYRNVFYTGAAFQGHNSGDIWAFTEVLLEKLVATL